MLPTMSSGYLVLIIYDLYCKCLGYVFVKIVEVLVSAVHACGVLWRFKNPSACLTFLVEMVRCLPGVSWNLKVHLDCTWA